MSFPLNNNDPYIKSTGERSTLGAELAKGGTSELPEYDSTDAGKVLTVGDDGELEWDTKGTGGGDKIVFDYYHKSAQGGPSYTDEKTYTILENGTYYIFIGVYTDSLTFKINDVAQDLSFSISNRYIYGYYNNSKTLQAGDVLTIKFEGNGESVRVINVTQLAET